MAEAAGKDLAMSDEKKILDPGNVKAHKTAFRNVARKLGAFYAIRQGWVTPAGMPEEDARALTGLQDGSAALFLMYSSSGKETDILEEARKAMTEDPEKTEFTAADVFTAIKGVFLEHGQEDLLPPWIRGEFEDHGSIVPWQLPPND